MDVLNNLFYSLFAKKKKKMKDKCVCSDEKWSLLAFREIELHIMPLT